MTRSILIGCTISLALVLTAFSPDGLAAPVPGAGLEAAPAMAPADAPAGAPAMASAPAPADAPDKAPADAPAGAPAMGPAEAPAGAGQVTVAAEAARDEERVAAGKGKKDRRRKWAHSDDFGKDPPAVAIAVPISFFLFVLGLVAVILVINFRKDRLRHETLRLIVERGGEIPAELLAGPRKRPSSDLRKGVILIACGVGLGLFLALVAKADQDRQAWSLGFIPTLIGLGYLLVWRLERRGAPSESLGPAGGTISGGDRAQLSDRTRIGQGDQE
ncbi:MAG: DUF6249 domain-containing protein [Polyangia bacterium]|nr:DUF6249 domain-containing protein [Polyangia bacterium]